MVLHSGGARRGGRDLAVPTVPVMRTRDRDEDWIEELGRRRLEALIAELTPPADRRVGLADDELGDEPVPTDVSDLPVLEEVPGRHARRALAPGDRLRGWLSDRTPHGVARQALQQGHVGLLALVLAVAVLLGGWAWVRSSGAPPSPAAAPVVAARGVAAGSSGSPGLLAPSSGASPAGSPSAVSGASAASEVVVHVAGRVRRPGIVVLPVGSRVIDAVKRAGGFAPGVGPRSAALNLARVLVDGEQIVVGGQPGAPVAGAAAPADGASAGPLVSLNTADQTALESLPGVGPVTAAAILQWREENGPFTSVDQLLEVSGIGDKTLAEIAPHVTL